MLKTVAFKITKTETVILNLKFRIGNADVAKSSYVPFQNLSLLRHFIHNWTNSWDLLSLSTLLSNSISRYESLLTFSSIIERTSLNSLSCSSKLCRSKPSFKYLEFCWANISNVFALFSNSLISCLSDICFSLSLSWELTEQQLRKVWAWSLQLCDVGFAQAPSTQQQIYTHYKRALFCSLNRITCIKSGWHVWSIPFK